MGKPVHWIVILQLSSAFAYRYDPWYRADAPRPVDAIADTVNDLGVKILQQYTAHGNVAFSPTGVAFVLAALYEGSAGRGSKQIAEAMGLPLNRDVTRIGFRDIHRRLRSYLNADGFLGGLTLSRENTKLRPEYEDVLRFYGFDLSSIEQEANVTVSMENSSTTEPSTSTVGLTSPLTGATSMDTITSAATLPPVNVEGTTVPAAVTATNTVEIVTAPTATTNTATKIPATVQNTLTTQSADSTTTLTSSESVQPSAGAESTMTASPLTANPGMSTGLASTTSMDSQASPSTVTIVLADDQGLQMSSIIADGTGATGSIVISASSQTVSTPIASFVAVAQNATTQSAVTTSESVQLPSLFAGAESTAGSPSTGLVPATSVDRMGTGTTGTIVADDQSDGDSQTQTTTVTVNVDNVGAGNVGAATDVTEGSITSIQAPDATATATASANVGGTTASMVVDDGVPTSVLAASTEASMATSVSSSDSAVTIPASLLDTNSNIDSQASTEVPAAEVITSSDLTTMPAATNVNADETTMVSAEEGNATSSDVGNLGNSTVNSVLEDQMNPTLMNVNQMLNANQGTVPLNRKRRTAGTVLASNASASKLDNVMNDNSGTTNRLNRQNRPNPRKRGARSPRGYFSSYPDEGIWMQDLEIWKSYGTRSSESPMGDTTAEISFLVNGCDVSSVSASRYIAVLPFAYFPSLHAVALEFPLDDPRYNIILLMPTDKTDAHRLARDLSGNSLRLLRKRLQSTWVRATIPSFMLRGFVTLTSFLQGLGILDVFDPRVADLSPMTSDLGVYARDIQQSIGINIRNYMKPDRTHSRESSNIVPPRRDYYRYLSPGNGLFERAGPVPFTAMHPFLYFIVDTETSVSLIAGRVDDPLNSRIL